MTKTSPSTRTTTTLDRTLAAGARRLGLVRSLSALAVMAAAGAGALLALRVAERGFGVTGIDWPMAWSITAGAALLGALAWTWVTRPSREVLARTIDERCGLKATLATGLWSRSSASVDAWTRAASDEAEQAAGRVVFKDAFPLDRSRAWLPAGLCAALVIGGGFVPRTNLIELFADDPDTVAGANESESEDQIIQIRQDIDKGRDEIEQALDALQDEGLKEQLAALDEPLPDALSPEELRTAEMKRLSTLQDKLEEAERNGIAQEAAAARAAMKAMRRPSGLDSEATRLAEAIQRGDMQAAKDAVDNMASMLDSGQLSQEERDRLAEQLEELAEQLEEAAQQQQQALEEALEQAGLDPGLASNPQALQQAIQNAQNLTQQQKQQLQQQANQNQQNAGQCRNCAGGMSRMANAMSQGQGGQQAGQQLGQQLSGLEMAQQQMDALRAAQNTVQQQMAQQGQGRNPGTGNKQNRLPPWAQKPQLTEGGGGNGAGNSGIGGEEEPDPNNVELLAGKPDAEPTGFGPTIGSMTVEGGTQLRGESVAQFRETARAGSEAAADAIDERLVPKEYEDVVKKYFGGLENEASSAESGSEGTQSEGAESP